MLSPAQWSVNDVVAYIRHIGFESEASEFQAEDIDGKSLLLLTREDVLNCFRIKLGPAIKLYAYIQYLQRSCRSEPQPA